MTDVLRVLYAVLMVLSSAACICGNLLLLLVLLLNKELWSDTLGFTLSHSLSDLALGLSTMPFGAHNALFWPSGPPGEGLLCQGSGFLFLLLQVSSVHSLAWATVDKFTEICFALSYSRIWTGRRSLAVLVLVWLFCLVSASLPLLGFGSYSYSESRFLCCPKFIRSSSFVLLWTVAGVAAPILAVCCLYGYIVYVALKQAKRGTFMCNELHCFYVPAKNYLRSSIVMVATSGEFLEHQVSSPVGFWLNKVLHILCRLPAALLAAVHLSCSVRDLQRSAESVCHCNLLHLAGSDRVSSEPLDYLHDPGVSTTQQIQYHLGPHQHFSYDSTSLQQVPGRRVASRHPDSSEVPWDVSAVPILDLRHPPEPSVQPN